ncbi:alpha/beta hydrolase [Catenulispora yoronensis]|uniref:Alpha/beta hydrolase n=1 Tax=Catenulispora yoronensis TaxID=450799 RepID=A0ABP5GJG9_9ACTN
MRFGKRAAALACGVGFGAAGVGVAGTAEATAGPTSAASAVAAVAWQPCPQYSDDVLAALGYRPEDYASFRALWARTDCGTVSVPLDYRDPAGQHITIALTRLKAQDTAHRRGIMFMNPGGPGGSGYLMPAQLLLQNPADAGLNQDYDLIGFDPRGIGYSTSYDCPRDGSGPNAAVTADGAPGSGPLTQADVQEYYDRNTAGNAACSASNPTFLRQITTSNAARDLDSIRGALHERKASYFGASWGTQLGAVYRSLFPATIDRMWLDSVVSPHAYELAYRFAGTARASEDDFHQFAAWLAARNSTYGFGDTAAKVEATVLAMRQQADASPWKFSDLDATLDGSFIGFLAGGPNLVWDQAAPILLSLTTAVNGGPAPEPVKQVISGPRTPPPPPPAGTPADFNQTANVAYLCNEDTSDQSFQALWDGYQRTLAANPVTGEYSGLRPTCAGWTLPPQPITLRWSPGSLQMSGHLHESVTPYPWVKQMQATIGGTVFTVQDYIHGSAPFVPECAQHIVTYFETGRPDNGTCPGLQPEPAPAGGATASAATAHAAADAARQAVEPLVFHPAGRKHSL